MPLRKRKQIDGPAVFYVTTSTYNRGIFPGLPGNYDVLERYLFDTASDKKINIFAYVIMPTHLHLLLGSTQGGPGLSGFMHSFKGRSRKAIIDQGPFWQSRFDDLVIYTQKVFEIKLNYIHFNPVMAVLVENPEDWPYSSYLDWKNHRSSKGENNTFEGWYKGKELYKMDMAVGSGDPTAHLSKILVACFFALGEKACFPRP
jgi:putative transposase